MASKPVPRRRADGTLVYRVPFRLVPGGTLTSESFDGSDGAGTMPDAKRALRDALAFGALVDKIGGQAARDHIEAAGVAAKDTPALATFLETVLADIDAARAQGTAPEYRRLAARTWLPRFGDLPVDAITRDAVIRWVAWQREQETARSKAARAKAIAAQRSGHPVEVPEPVRFSPKTIRNAQALLSQVLAAAVEKGLVASNVARGVRLPSDAERREMVFLTENEFVLLDAQIPEHYRPLVQTLYGTGLRWGEATALTPGSLDLDAPIPVLRVTRAWKKAATGSTGYLGSPKTKKARRTVALPAQLVPVLREVARGKRADALLFTTPSGTQVGQAHFHEQVWTPALARAAKADPPLTKRPRIHDLRHSHASNLIARGMDMLTLADRLGHESVKTTGDTYGHLRPDALILGAALAGASLAGALPQIES